MSGHSRWSKIQHKKGKADKARSGVFTKLLRGITVAAGEGGGDVEMNFSLRLAVEKAKAANVPKDNIERAIKRGTGEDKEGAIFESGLYEGFGPGGIAVMVETLTDNTNRTVSEVKHIFSKYGGSMGASGSVQWQFEHVGAVRIMAEELSKLDDKESFLLELLDNGAEDVKDEEEGMEIISSIENLKKVLDFLSAQELTPEESGLEWMAKDTIELDAEKQAKLDKLIEMFDECDDVKEVYTNAG